MLIFYILSLFVSYELGKAGHKQAAKIARVTGELINNIIDIMTLKVFLDAISDNPAMSAFKSISYDLQLLASYIQLTNEPSKIKFQQGLEGTYIAPVETIKTLLGIEKESKEPSGGKTFSDFKKSIKTNKTKSVKGRVFSDFKK